MALKIVALLIGAVGLFGTVLPVIPGPPLIFAAALGYAWLTDFVEIGAGPLWILGGLALLAQIVDFVTGSVAPRLVGATRQAALGALLGSILGLFMMGPIGLLVGPIAGVLIVELSAGRRLADAGRAGLAAGVGVIVGTVAKGVLALAMFLLFAISLFR